MSLDLKKISSSSVAFQLLTNLVPIVMLTLLGFLDSSAAAQQTSTKPAWSVSINIKAPITETDGSETDGSETDGSETDGSALDNIETMELMAEIENKVLVGAAPINAVVLLTPNLAAIISLRQTLDSQFKHIQLLAETEESFDQRFGELYSAYARTLLKVGRLADARRMFANALHNVKINHGVNSLQQRPVLRELFEMELASGNVSDAERHLKRLKWIEKGDTEDSYSFDMVMALGNYYLNQYLISKKPTEKSLVGLNKSIHYFGYALRRYSAALITTLPLPYGDFAYAHYLKKQVRSEVDFALYINARERSVLDLDTADSRRLSNNGFAQSNYFLRQSYTEAKKSLDVEGSVKALLSIGDLYLLYGNVKGANTYYQLARKNTGHLPISHPIIESFDAPLKLPAFTLSIKRDHYNLDHAYQTVPMLLDIDTAGHVKNIVREPQVDLTMAMRIRAKQTAERLRFRPIIEDGKLKSIENHRYNVQVLARELNTSADTQADE